MLTLTSLRILQMHYLRNRNNIIMVQWPMIIPIITLLIIQIYTVSMLAEIMHTCNTLL